MSAARRAGRTLLLAFAALATLATAQPQLSAPLDRLVPPGDFVTLVFRVALPAGAEATDLPLELSVEPDWRVVRRPDALAVEPGREGFVPITLEVPADAAADGEARVTLRSGVAEATVRLTVAARRALELDAPELVVLGGDPLLARVRNLGNVALAARLELRLDGAPVDEATLELPPGADLSVALEPVATGFHQLLLQALDEPLRRSVEVIRFGVPPPEPLRLAGRLGSSGARSPGLLDGRIDLELDGPLSDFVGLELLASSELDTSYAELVRTDPAGGSWELRLGDLRRPPFGLGLPDALGVRLVAPAADHRGAAVIGWREGAPSVWLATERVRTAPPSAPGGDPGTGAGAGDAAGGAPPETDGARTETVAFAVGTDRGAIDGRLRLRLEEGPTDLGGSASLRLGAEGGELGLELEAEHELAEPAATLRGDLELARLLAGEPRLALGGRARTPAGDELYASLRVGLRDGTASWRLGAVQRLPSELPGRFRQLLQVGLPLSYAELRHDIALGGGWQAQSGAGLRVDLSDAAGPGLAGAAELLLRSSWVYTRGPDNGLQGNAELRWRPADGRIGGAVGARLDRVAGPVEIAAEAGWDLDLGEVEVQTGIGAELDAWRLEAQAGLLWRTDEAAPEWRAGLGASWRFDLAVPPGLVAAAGGRDLGTLRLLLRSGDEPLEGVVVRAGRYRLVTDAQGVAEARLEPGPVDVRLELGSLPVAFALDGPAERRVEVRLQEATEVAFPLLRTAELRGRVLLDSDGDGAADAPPRGAQATLLLRDARGVARTLRSAADGSFAARGLLPGEVEVALTERPFGSSVVGPSQQRLRLGAGESAAVEFLLRPPEATARSFGGDLARIGRIELQAERVPPGAAPWIEATLRGDVGDARVVLLAGGGERPLERRGDRWFGRLPVPADAPAGVLAFEVEVRSGGAARGRRGQLLIDPGVPLATFAAAGPAAPGGSSALSAEVLAEAVAVVVRSPFREGERSALVETAPGRWSGTLPVPADATDAVHGVVAEVRLADGAVLTLETGLRVLR